MTTTLSTPFLSLVRKADPGYLKERQCELEYSFTRRRFYGNPAERWPYNYPATFLETEDGQRIVDEDYSNVLVE